MWLLGFRLTAACAKLDQLEQELSSVLNDNHVLEVRAAQAERAAIHSHEQLQVSKRMHCASCKCILNALTCKFNGSFILAEILTHSP